MLLTLDHLYISLLLSYVFWQKIKLQMWIQIKKINQITRNVYWKLTFEKKKIILNSIKDKEEKYIEILFLIRKWIKKDFV